MTRIQITIFHALFICLQVVWCFHKKWIWNFYVCDSKWKKFIWKCFPFCIFCILFVCFINNIGGLPILASFGKTPWSNKYVLALNSFQQISNIFLVKMTVNSEGKIFSLVVANVTKFSFWQCSLQHCFCWGKFHFGSQLCLCTKKHL